MHAFIASTHARERPCAPMCHAGKSTALLMLTLWENFDCRSTGAYICAGESCKLVQCAQVTYQVERQRRDPALEGVGMLALDGGNCFSFAANLRCSYVQETAAKSEMLRLAGAVSQGELVNAF